MKNDKHDFKEFMKRREEASQAFVNGNAAPLDGVATHTSPATIFGPVGDYVEGAEAVNAANQSGARHCVPSGESHRIKFERYNLARNQVFDIGSSESS